ncbi:sll0787 family AIR synthase-like protein [Parageobacillus thermoglucosidasius]|uniref:sll0787 family AIR synthase-like protein n=1 Tax=Parageobacillus thermoglucosidasius TaxID=1426 RepID=UPI000F61783C|nr:sll0787 family AIR synthase-like protein [Parageobacillus thermoglucosidasius]BDG33819.1 methanogenesis marker 2 protein [Parageobacillus thermoglucosidasius]GCD84424.1 methanogenesis marker 2 protein [Parageobacillus thermoglucosidasius]
MGTLHSLIRELQDYIGITRKKAIQSPLKAFQNVWNFGSTLDPIGDDAAILVTGNEYLLLACDAIYPQLVAVEPFWAGYCSVLVSVNDIYAMGGRPTAAVNLLSAPDDNMSETIAQGMAEACRKYGVPMVGGHYLPEETAGVATAMVGRATHLLRCFHGRPGQWLMVAVDLEGRQFKDYLQWDSTSFRTPQDLQSKLAVLPMIAELQLATAARDISNAGLIGTLAMLAEASECGARVDLNSIPKPYNVDFSKWIKMFPGYGFILAVDPEHAGKVQTLFQKEQITAKVIGELTEDPNIVLHSEEETAVLFNWSRESLVVGDYGG